MLHTPKQPVERTESSALSAVLDLLHLECLGDNHFRGNQPDEARTRVFGGQIAAQSLMAAARTVVDTRLPNSLHVYFLQPGNIESPIDYHVTHLRDGGATSVRRVSALQNGAIILEALMSFSEDMEGPEYQRSMPSAPSPESLLPLVEQLAPYADEHDGWWVRPRPFDFRYVTVPPRVALDQPQKPGDRVNRLWLRADGTVPDDPVLHSCLLTYVSDITLLDPVMVAVGRTSRGPGMIASIDHAIWFQRRGNLNDWIFYDQQSPSAAAGSGMAWASMFDCSGKLLCLVSQEGYLGRGQ